MIRQRFIALFVIIFAIVFASSSAWSQSKVKKQTPDLRSVDANSRTDIFPGSENTSTELLDSIMRNGIAGLQIGERVAAVGKLFLGKPYLDKTLDFNHDKEILVCNLSGFDCVTFFENSWDIARAIRLGGDSFFSNILAQLTDTRYRNGKINGFASRLHYTSDYFFDNARRGHLRSVTKSIGKKYAVLETKTINFMSAHPNLYPQLKEDLAMQALIKIVEDSINARGGYYMIKKENVKKVESSIKTGDLIGITTTVSGIDCSHTGIAIKLNDGRIHFMHASSAMKKVIISEVPLAEYLANNAKQTGIMIYRPLEVTNK